ncbi:hypothetical protein Gogos_005957 [Gossypium gossypioides]|uniref:CCHC-type domain-containing protein n=1 Tax=Gossypium gossypioides TaxID=34282 RepID=A0A7J9C449_GOSGO|nr:hypothetical protein [Gossypium gossypioides]
MNGAESLSDDRIGEGEDSTADRNTKRVQFKYESDDSLANMVVDSSPISRVSWKDKLLRGSVSNSLNGVVNLNVEFEDGDISRSNLNGIPAIDFSDRINKILIKGIELTVVVKLLGRNIGYRALYNHITSLWKPTQSFRLMDVANGYYLIRFQSRCVGLDPLSRTAGIPVPEEDIREDWKFGWRMLVNGQLERVEIEALSEVCFSCGKYGHLKNLCPSSLTDRSGHGGEGIPKTYLSSKIASANKGDALLKMGEAFGR